MQNELIVIQPRLKKNSNDKWNDSFFVGNRENGLLAYMTAYDTTKACEKRVDTGVRWAEWGGRFDFVSRVFDNELVEGFVVHGFDSRSSTDNKWIRIFDPRGFVVEMSVKDFTNFLTEAEVIKGHIKGLWRWKKNGKSWTLIK